MPNSNKETSKRKKDHIDLCLNEDVGFSSVTNGFDNYHFEHFAVTEVNYDQVDLTTDFFGQIINYPFLISCMTGGTAEAERINESIAITANQLNIPIGVGSQRQAMESDEFYSSFKTITKNAGNVPILGNIGAAQVAQSKNVQIFQKLVDMVSAKVLVIHLNPLQELIQQNGEPNFTGLLKNIEKMVAKINVPILAKEVGSGISKRAAKLLLEAGISGIDVAGAGGTSWAQVELKRNKTEDEYFRNWGLPTSYCIRQVGKLKKKYKFTLIASGGIDNGVDIAKSIAMGANLAASARPILKSVMKEGIDGVEKLINEWFLDVKKIMYLTGCKKIYDLSKQKLIHKSDLQ